jgi:hypothetical protein
LALEATNESKVKAKRPAEIALLNFVFVFMFVFIPLEVINPRVDADSDVRIGPLMGIKNGLLSHFL